MSDDPADWVMPTITIEGNRLRIEIPADCSEAYSAWVMQNIQEFMDWVKKKADEDI